MVHETTHVLNISPNKLVIFHPKFNSRFFFSESFKWADVTVCCHKHICLFISIMFLFGLSIDWIIDRETVHHCNILFYISFKWAHLNEISMIFKEIYLMKTRSVGSFRTWVAQYSLRSGRSLRAWVTQYGAHLSLYFMLKNGYRVHLWLMQIAHSMVILLRLWVWF